MVEAPSQGELRGLIRDTGQLVCLQMVCGNIFPGNSRGVELISGICNCTTLVANRHTGHTGHPDHTGHSGHDLLKVGVTCSQDPSKHKRKAQKFVTAFQPKKW